MHRLVLVGLNHTTAPLAIREKLCFPGDARKAALASFREKFAEAEAVLVSTCNRVELYVARSIHGHPRAEEMIAFLAGFHSLAPQSVEQHFYKKAEAEAVTHLFSVASSLDSMVLGETQIIGQIRESYELAQRLSITGTLLNPLFQRAIAVGKQVLNETPLGEGRLSVASVAVEYARQIFDRFSDKTVLSIGAGKMSQLVLQSFSLLRPGKLLICNRDPNRAAALAGRFGGSAVPFERLGDHLAAADIVISSTGAVDPIITRRQFEQIVRVRRYRPVFLIDIALPRDIEAGVGELENVYLYNIDDLQQVVATTHLQRQSAVEAARRIVSQQVEEFVAWNRARQVGPLIDAMYKRYHEIAQAEVARALGKFPDLTEEQRARFEDMGRRIVNKLLHGPIQRLRVSDGLHAPMEHYLRAIERLFQLETDLPAAEQPQPAQAEDAREEAGDA